MQVTGSSITGRRKINQDRILFQLSNECFVLAVADGMGGYEGGEIASQAVIDICRSEFASFSSAPSMEALGETIMRIGELSQKRVAELSKVSPEHANMGTTLTIALGFRGRYVIGNIGDSRAYVFKGQEPIQITRDNSFVRDYRDKYDDEVTDEGWLKRMGHVLTRSISGGEDKVDLYPGAGRTYRLRSGEVLLLCSDGLIVGAEGVAADTMKKIIEGAHSIMAAAESLVEYAYAGGSGDNISLVLLVNGPWSKRCRERTTKRRMMIPVAAAAACVALMFVGINRFGRPSTTDEVGSSLSFISWSIDDEPMRTTSQNDRQKVRLHVGDNMSWYFRVENDSIQDYTIYCRDLTAQAVYPTVLEVNRVRIGDIPCLVSRREYEIWIRASTFSGLVDSTHRVVVKIEG